MLKRSCYLLVLAGLIWSLFFGFGDIILFGKSIIIRILIFLLIFVGTPLTLFLFLNTFRIKRDLLVNKIVPISVLILGPGFGLWANYVSKNDLRQYGRTIYGNIVTREWSSGKPKGWIVAGEFKYKGKQYRTFTKTEQTYKYKIGETVLVRFSTRNPENNELVLK